jgi:fluoride ion exporter CrcB/FEX
MIYILPCIIAFAASLLTFFSGFGLGTLLTPVFAIFFPIDIAIASTALVHFFNNIFKFIITAKHINKRVLFEFGLPSFFAATGGAFMLFFLADAEVLYTYQIAHHQFEITIMKCAIGIMIILFSVLENVKSKSMEQKSLFFGGLLSGFCGGLSTFSTFGYETFLMFKQGLHLFAFLNIAFSLLTGLGVFYVFIKHIQ